MSSVTSSRAQISGRIKFFLGIDNDTDPTDLADAPAFTLAATTVIPTSTVSRAKLNLGTSAGGFGATVATVAVNALYKDLGRQVVVFDDTVAGNPHTEVFREVTRMNGATTEGISAVPAPMLFVKVYSSAGANVAVVRTG
jgi:hypothetical protein